MSLRVADRSASESFFETVLPQLGIDKTYRTEAFAQWGDFELTEADGDHAVTRGLHVAFTAPSHEQVDEFWQAGVDAGHPDDGAPGPRPQYRGDYYRAVLRDPDGNSVEAVHHAARRRDGAIDHLWIRVADLGVATAFYRIVAAAAGFELRHEDAELSRFGRPAQGGTFTLLQGPPTEQLHMAFAGDDDAVRRFYDDSVAAGHRGTGEPGERPQYHRGYYAAYVLDPDGNDIEVVNHHLA